jgi:NAD(P)-dependent dehydrogenase (short-subunit alcohol dehydrogenase family)
MNQIPGILYADEDFTTWLIIGASRGIGLEFVRQLLNCNERIIATVREPFASHASALWGQAGSDHGRCQMYVCDILSEESIVVRRLNTVTVAHGALTRVRNSCSSSPPYQTSKSTM